LQGYIDGTKPCPTQQLTTTTNNITLEHLNPDYIIWIRQDQLILNAIIGSITPTIIPFIVRAKTSREAWNILAATYAAPSRGRIKQVKSQLRLLTKGTLSITDFLQSVKAKADELAVLGAPIDNEDLTDKILEELGDEYRELVRAVQARENAISFDELHEKLLMFEASLQATPKIVTLFPPTAHQASRTSRRYPFHNVNRNLPNNFSAGGNWRSYPQPGHSGPAQSYTANNSSRPPPRPYLGYCQICGIQGHTAKKCPSFRLVPLTTSQHNNTTLWQPQANLATSTPPLTSPWMLDNGASHHITSDLQNLAQHLPDTGTDDVMIGDGKGLTITHLGSNKLYSSTHSFNLNNILCVPDIKRNLISIYQFCVDNNVSIEFLPWCFLVKDLLTGEIRAKGKTNEGVYEWPCVVAPHAFSSVKLAPINWHLRLGHPAFSVLNTILSKHNLNSSSISKDFVCNACHCNKSHKLPFSVSSLLSHNPLELIFSNVWTSPLLSIDGFKYYVIFVYHFTKYIWFYPLRKKSEVKPTFIRFKAIVENYFKKKIMTLYSDNGGEYIVLTEFFATHGISHLTTPPHTPEHNGFAERRHRHIVETGLALLTHASLPRLFWSYAFATAVYLINRMPTPTLKNHSPYDMIFQCSPHYEKLRVFGCLCYPWLRPYNAHKLEPRSKPCIFLGYSLSQSAYLCFEPKSSKIIVSRHVSFHEHIFPYHSLHHAEIQLESTAIDMWIPPEILVPKSIPAPSTHSSAAEPDISTISATFPLPIILPPPSVPASQLTMSSLPTSSPTIPSQPTSSPALPIPSQTDTLPCHSMTTRSKNNIRKPIQKLIS